MEKNINIHGYSISYIEVNPSSKSTLLFIHGNSLSKAVFEQQISSNILSKYRLIALDLLGHGKSEKSKNPTEQYNVPFFAELIANFIAALQLSRVVLVGHSLGGHIAIEVAGRFPENIIGMTMNGCPPLGIPADMSAAFLPNPLTGLLFQSELNDTEIDDLSQALVYKENKTVLINALQNSDPEVRSSLGASIMAANYTDEIEILKEVKVPYAIFLGENDTFCNADYFNKYNFTNQWKGQLQMIPAGTHTPYLDDAKVINNLLLAFLTENNL